MRPEPSPPLLLVTSGKLTRHPARLYFHLLARLNDDGGSTLGVLLGMQQGSYAHPVSYCIVGYLRS